MKAIRRIFMIGLILVLIGGTSFYLLVGLGLSPKLQTIWVTTAMTTMNHKWLATSIIPEDKINQIIEENHVDDSGYNTDISLVDVPEINNEIVNHKEPLKNLEDVKFVQIKKNIDEKLEKEKEYIETGYNKLEEGLFLKEVSGTGWRGYIMLVQDPKRVVIQDTPNQYSIGNTVKKMVEIADGVAGINGGGFNDGPNYDSNGGSPSGIIIKNGELISPKTKDDKVYNIIGITDKGALVLAHNTIDWAFENNIKQAVSFSPFLIVNGEGTIKKGTGGWGIAPRTAIGQRKSGEMLFLVIDGRQPTWSIGVDLKVLQDVLLKEGCINAAMLDGGSSTVMVYKGEFVNKPSLGRERYINNAFVVKKINEPEN